MNNLKLITAHNGYLLLVNISEIKLGDKIVHGNVALKLGWNWGVREVLTIERLNSYKETQELMRKFPSERTKTVITEPIIAHLPLNNAPKLEGVPLLPELPKQEEDVNELARSAFITMFIREPKADDEIAWMETWKLGYYKSHSKKWSDEDMGNLWDFCTYNKGTFKEAIQSLSSKTPIGFVLSDRYDTLAENIEHGRYVFE